MANDSHTLYGPLCQFCRDIHVVQESEDHRQISARVSLPASYAGFSGHFPGKPVLPAIIQLAVVRNIGEHCLGTPLFPTAFRRIKFKGMILPDDIFTVELELDRSDGGWTAHFKLKSPSGKALAEGQGDFITLPGAGQG